MNRRGMELAVNTLVVMIIGITIVIGGTAMVYKLSTKATQLVGEVPQQTQDQLFSILLGSKQRIAVLNNVQTVNRGNNILFPVAFQNQQEGSWAYFSVMPELALSPSTATCPSNACPIVMALPGPYNVSRYASKPFHVSVIVPREAPAGEYIFEIAIFNSTSAYHPSDTINYKKYLYARSKIHVIVP